MNKKNLIIIGIIFVLIILLGLFLLTGRARTDVYLKDFELSQDETKMTLNIGVSSSAGYVRKLKRTSGSMNYYYTFYSTYGINSKIGAKDTFVIDIDNNVDEIYFYTGNKGYKKVLEKDELGIWKKVLDNEQISSLDNVTANIFDISLTSATIVITDKNKEPNIYGEWYRLEKEQNGKWIELKTLINNYGFNEIGYLPNENNEVKFVINWEKLYGKLDYGSYRIVKKVNDSYLYIPFGVATTS